MSDHTNSHSPACDHLTASARRYMDPAQCSTCRAYQRGREDAAKAVEALPMAEDFKYLRFWRDDAIIAASGIEEQS